MTIKRALIVKAPYAGLIVDGYKTLEMRSRHTRIRERIGIIEAGTGTIIGEANLTGSYCYRKDGWLKSLAAKYQHCIPCKYWDNFGKHHYGWTMSNAERYKQPVPYAHPPGAQLWVTLANRV